MDWSEVAIHPGRALTQSVHIGFSDYDRAGLLKPGDSNSIFGGYTVLEVLESGGRSDSGGVVEIFDSYRNAMQGTTPFSCLDLCFRDSGFFKRLLSKDGNECIQ